MKYNDKTVKEFNSDASRSMTYYNMINFDEKHNIFIQIYIG